MNPKLFLWLALVLGSGCIVSHADETNPPTDAETPPPFAAHNSPKELASNWEYIIFPYLTVDGKGLPSFLAGDGEHPSQASRGFKFQIMGISPGFFKTNRISARLYQPNGRVAEPTTEGRGSLNSPVYLSTFSVPDAIVPAQVLTYFPWGTNALEESWMEVNMGPERYWLEIPYGFDRNPADPLPPAIAAGPPKWIPAMKPLTEHDHVIRWQSIQYDLGEIENGWRLTLIQSNTRHPESTISLYPVSGQTAKPLQGPDAPHIAVRIVSDDGTVLTGRRVNDHPDRPGRYTFRFGRCGGETRCWGRIEISAWNKTYSVVVPSSLYKYNHGHVPQLIHNINSK